MFIKNASLRNYADKNTRPAFTTNIDDLIEIVTDESQKTSHKKQLMKLDQMMLNPKKFP